MQMNEKTLQMILDLGDAPGPSGFEDEAVAVARRYADGLGEIREDFLRNLYIYRKENTGKKPVLMLDAHSDEVGFMVHSIKPNGTLRFVTLGGWNKNALISSKVLVRNALGEYIPGIIASKPVHFMKAAERQNPGMEISDMVIDIGAASAQEAAEVFHIRMGEPVVPATKCSYDRDHDLIFGKGFDCRIGCAALIEALRRVEGKDLPCDVVGVLSSQEEVGERGCKVTVNRVKPDIAIVLEGCPADDTFTEPYAIQTALKRGPMFRHMDKSVICAPRFQRFALNLAAERGIPVQESVREGGGNNAAMIQSSLLGAPAIVAGVPVRYIHSMNCISSYFDFEATVSMVVALLESITPEVIASM
ncbi:MAG: M42 family peptidase [Oscillospiraceae bacterium]|nr:M42 family peptidase [Oscillospiraceae bacterium]